MFGAETDTAAQVKAEYLYSYSVELFPVPYGSVAPTEGDTKVSTEYLRNFINSKTVNLPTEGA